MKLKSQSHLDIESWKLSVGGEVEVKLAEVKSEVKLEVKLKVKLEVKLDVKLEVKLEVSLNKLKLELT